MNTSETLSHRCATVEGGVEDGGGEKMLKGMEAKMQRCVNCHQMDSCVSRHCDKCGVRRVSSRDTVYGYYGSTLTNYQARQSSIRRVEYVVYFVQADCIEGLIKIGTTSDFKCRMQLLSSSSPVRLKLLGVIKGSVRYERQLHERFKEARQHGEWFKPTPCLLDFIRQASEANLLAHMGRIV